VVYKDKLLIVKRQVLLRLTLGLLGLLASGCSKAAPKKVRFAPEPDLKLLQAPQADLKSWKDLSGKVVVVEFWGTYCEPCIAAIPHLNELSRAFAGKPVQFISVTNESETRVRKFLVRHPMLGWIGLDPGDSLALEIGLLGIPHTVIIDQRGRLADIMAPSAVNEGVIAGILAGQRPMGVGASISPIWSAEDHGLYYVRIATGTPLRFDAIPRFATGRYKRIGFPLIALLSELYDFPVDRIDVGSRAKRLYDIDAMIPGDFDKAGRPVIQAALKLALGLKIRREKHLMDVLALERGKGPLKLALSLPGEETQTWRGFFAEGKSSGALASIVAKREPLSGLTSCLENWIFNKPVIDETGLGGLYDVNLHWDPAKAGDVEHALGRLGLRLEAKKHRVEVLVFRPVKSSK
jgi:uncharacterized protein (TIGR03435 family)